VSALRIRVAQLTGSDRQIERLSGGDLSEVLLIRRADGHCTVAKGGAAVSTEAAMLRAIAGLGAPAPAVEAEYDGVLLLEHVANDGVFSPKAWTSLGVALRRLHEHHGEAFGWPVDYALGSVALHNRETRDWVRFWGEQRLVATAAVLDRPWRERVESVVSRLADILPAHPPTSFLHGDLWTGNILVRDGSVAGLIDPACYHGHAEVDLAMLTLFDTPAADFWAAYGAPEAGWQERRSIYQLFPALVHLRLFGASYAGLVDRLLSAARA
jgi:fructosamine-3-kinase